MHGAFMLEYNTVHRPLEYPLAGIGDIYYPWLLATVPHWNVQVQRRYGSEERFAAGGGQW